MNFMFGYISYIALGFCPFSSGDITSQVSSEHASYEEKRLILEGNVVLDHDLGKIEAETAILFKNEEKSDSPFTHVQLQNHVHLYFKDHAELHCDAATLDFIQGEGVFSSQSSSVLYRDFLEKQGELLEISSKEIQFTLNESGIDHLLAKTNVTVLYAQDFYLKANRALYSKTKEIEMLAEEDGAPCLLSHLEDEIYAKKNQSQP